MIEHVQETLGRFQDHKFFSLLEEKKEMKKKIEENTSGSDKEDKELKAEEESEGMEVIDKLKDNLSRFQTAAGGKILKYKEFWEENSEAKDGFDEGGEIYKLWDSNYVAGVLTLPDEALSDDELNAAIELVDEEKPEEDEEDKEEKDDEGEEDEEDEDGGEEDKEEDKEEDEEDEEDTNESWRPKGEDFLLEGEDEDGELPADDVVTPDEETEEEKEETDQEGFTGFDPDALDKDTNDSEESEDKDEFSADDEVEVEDGEAVELEGDLDGDGEVEGGMEFGLDGGESEYFVVYDMKGSERDEVFRTDSPKVIEAFKDFFENEFKAAIRSQIQAFKEAQEEKRKEAERIAKEEIRKQKRGKLDKFLKESKK